MPFSTTDQTNCWPLYVKLSMNCTWGFPDKSHHKQNQTKWSCAGRCSTTIRIEVAIRKSFVGQVMRGGEKKLREQQFVNPW